MRTQTDVLPYTGNYADYVYSGTLMFCPLRTLFSHNYIVLHDNIRFDPYKTVDLMRPNCGSAFHA